jgi:hypothetical protein
MRPIRIRGIELAFRVKGDLFMKLTVVIIEDID